MIYLLSDEVDLILNKLVEVGIEHTVLTKHLQAVPKYRLVGIFLASLEPFIMWSFPKTSNEGMIDIIFREIEEILKQFCSGFDPLTNRPTCFRVP